jgi:hypothetical protein
VGFWVVTLCSLVGDHGCVKLNAIVRMIDLNNFNIDSVLTEPKKIKTIPSLLEGRHPVVAAK